MWEQLLVWMWFMSEKALPFLLVGDQSITDIALSYSHRLGGRGLSGANSIGARYLLIKVDETYNELLKHQVL